MRDGITPGDPTKPAGIFVPDPAKTNADIEAEKSALAPSTADKAAKKSTKENA